ncbi:hypothetical protein GUJ93_ZPchr0006g45116 [Zizania palustris]|uniref:Uncharacterized protein n=1 Tax=Zizania palustris TaxID=103762 RepID=A0A8J5T517_ZIZPA|nr:hypothetical protein GUJ93_ZPchr0006g45116 [Zizania palustris]
MRQAADELSLTLYRYWCWCWSSSTSSCRALCIQMQPTRHQTARLLSNFSLSLFPAAGLSPALPSHRAAASSSSALRHRFVPDACREGGEISTSPSPRVRVRYDDTSRIRSRVGGAEEEESTVATPKLRDSIEAPLPIRRNPYPNPPIGRVCHAKNKGQHWCIEK